MDTTLILKLFRIRDTRYTTVVNSSTARAESLRTEYMGPSRAELDRSTNSVDSHRSPGAQKTNRKEEATHLASRRRRLDPSA
jgi:hypothetical protein